MNARLCRPAHELQEADFRTSSVWRFVTPDESEALNVDESYVVAQTTAPGTGQIGSYLVAAHYQLQAGTVLPGVVQLDILDKQLEFTPSTIFVAGKSVDPLGADTEIAAPPQDNWRPTGSVVPRHCPEHRVQASQRLDSQTWSWAGNRSACTTAAAQALAPSAVRPNPSLNRTRYGKAPWPGHRYAVHFPCPGQGALPPRSG